MISPLIFLAYVIAFLYFQSRFFVYAAEIHPKEAVQNVQQGIRYALYEDQDLFGRRQFAEWRRGIYGVKDHPVSHVVQEIVAY